MKRWILCLTICILSLIIFACKDKEQKIEYGDKEAVAEGTVVLNKDNPSINISNVKAKKGADIDYLSLVKIENEDEFPDLQVWVDASGVDIFEAGDYKAKYTFVYGGKSVEQEITVTIIDDGEKSASDVVENAGNNSSVNDNGNSGNSNGGNSGENNEGNNAGNNNSVNDGENGTTGNSGNNTQPTEDNNGAGGSVTPTTKNNTSTGNINKPTNATTSGAAKPTSNNGTTSSTTGSNSETTRREIITSAGSISTEEKNIGYSYIELLSGSTVAIKSTTAKYIVATRTDVSYKTKNGAEYKVSKLIITYNTGDERTLETVEEKVN